MTIVFFIVKLCILFNLSKMSEKNIAELDERMQIATAIISSTSAENMGLLIESLVEIIRYFAYGEVKSVDRETIQYCLDSLYIHLNESDAKVLLESVGYVLKEKKLVLNSTPIEIARRLDFLRNFFKEDLLRVEREEIEALEISIGIRQKVEVLSGVPCNLHKKMKDLKDGDLLTEGTVLFCFGSVIFRSLDNTEWKNDNLFGEFPIGTYIRIYKKGVSVEVKKKGN